MKDQIISSIKEFGLQQDNKGLFIDKSYKGIKYLHHWITENKYKKIHKEGLFMNIRNYHIRKNPINIFMKSFKRYERLVLTLNIDKINKKVIECSFTKYDIESDEIYLLEKNKNLDFNNFITYINEVCKREKKKLMVYRDNLSDELEFISMNIKNKQREELYKYELYDASRFFKRYEDNIDAIGPNIEDMLNRFNLLNLEETKIILKDSELRGKKIFQLINKISLIDLKDEDWNDEDSKSFYIKQREKEKGEI